MAIQRWRPAAATSFAVSFVVAMNRVEVVALNTIFALRLSQTRRTVGRTDSRLDGWSGGVTLVAPKTNCKSTARPLFWVLSIPIDIKGFISSTAHSELPETFKFMQHLQTKEKQQATAN